MNEEVLQPVPLRPAASVTSASQASRYRKRGRLQLRHETAAVVAEIRRMQRTHWSGPKSLPPRLVT